ncbi:MAG: efflux transporter outer membrane subunit [Alcaligenaceae bacterium]|nr:efflux transporter outer membrane subunit [Alcaligenaceae bacterium SAGV5]MPS52472.1 efflux transporter outer membrane subunit [Alcaligenaceae bacterium SAGV3]MPT57536.1 efflux transporter outer membrane subunit [Alcaligenaceae bacterium]
MRRWPIVLAVATLAGCAVGPDFRQPDAPAGAALTRPGFSATTESTPVKDGQAQQFLEGMDIPHRWWMLFRSPELNALVDQSLTSHPSVAAAQAALRQAHAYVQAQRGYFLPRVQANFSPSRQKNAGETPFTLYTSQLAVSYTPDIFGGNRRQVEALRASEEAQRFQLEATYLTLAANVVATAVEQASLVEQIEATQAIIASATRSLDILKKQFTLGYAAGTDVALAESALAQFQQALPDLQKQLERSRNMLAALTGGFPNQAPGHQFRLSGLDLPHELPVSLPSQLVTQRPDVRGAQAQLHAASAAIGVATADMLPQFSITAVGGGAATAFGHMFAAGNPFWSVVGEISQTLFAGGTLLYQKRAAEAAFDQAAAQYKETVIGAFQDVADTLYALQADAAALRAAARTEQAATRALSLVQKQLTAGQVDVLALLSSQQTYQEAVISRAQAQANRLADTAALFQALGGGWWNRPDDTMVASKAD